ncbi:MAG: DMT family transporter [Hyphomicrobiales bacterium]
MAVQTDIIGDTVAKGIGAMAVAVSLFAVADACAKWLGSAGFHPTQIVFLRYVFGLVPVTVALWLARGQGLRTSRPAAHLLRGFLMCMALLQFFWGLKFIPLAEAIAVAFTAPLFITALSVPVLRETVGPHRWAAVAVGFFGMLVILRPGTAAFQAEAFLIVGSALTFSVAVLYTRILTATESNAAMFTYTTIVSLIAMAPFALTTWQAPGEFDLALFALIGLVGGAAHFLVIVAYRHAPASVNAPFEYTALIWGCLLGWVIWREAPDAPVWIGAAVIIFAGLYITYRETMLGRAPVKVKDPAPH